MLLALLTFRKRGRFDWSLGIRYREVLGFCIAGTAHSGRIVSVRTNVSVLEA